MILSKFWNMGVKMSDCQITPHSAVATSSLLLGKTDNGVRDSVLIEYGGGWTTPCPTSCCQPNIFFGEQVEGTILRHSYSLSFCVGR